MTERPLHLYRYGSFAEGRRERLRQVLLESQLYFSSPLCFNDPFEGRVRFILPSDEEGWRRFANDPHFCGELGLSMKISDTARIAALMARQSSLSEHLSQPNLRKVYLGEVRACCFADSPTNLLMWSHYSDTHRGYCLEFTPQPDSAVFRSLEPVQYNDDLPVVVMGEAGEISARAVLLRKSTCWSYEREWRAISPEPNAHHSFEPEQLTAVVLGLDCSGDDVDQVREWNAARSAQVQLWKATRHYDEYGLVLKALA